ncbi:hypothetical protein [Glutamicibacter arilaitensis]|uniref:hypothetical protein n=1 Tax=Glutamicibacter arilaitensis TaxID=256701 RepID=UPI00384AF21C
MSGFAISVADNGKRMISSDFTPTMNKAERYALLGVHGCGIVNLQFVYDEPSAISAITSYGKSPESLGETLRGSLAILVRDTWYNRDYLLADPFGGCMVQRYKSDGKEYYASDLSTLKRRLASDSVTLKKSIEYIMSIGLMGNGGIVESPFMGVSVLKPYHYVQFDASGANEMQYRVETNLLDPSMKLEDSIDGFLNDLSLNVNAVSKDTASVKISQITGGMDSRLVLGGLIANELQDEFVYFVGGDDNSLDVRSARNLCSELGLTMTRYSGVDRSISPSGIDELTWPLLETNGVLQGSADPGLSANSNIILSGGYGEVLRSFYGKNRLPDLSNPQNTFRQVYGEFGLGNNTKPGLWSDDFVESTGLSLQNLIRESEQTGIRGTAQLDYLYLSTRNRYFVGEISRSMSTYTRRFDPLYSPYLLSILSNSSMESRHSGELQISLLTRLSRDLVEIPFDTPRVSEDFAIAKGLRLRKTSDHGLPNFDGRRNAIPVRPSGILPLPESNRLKARALEINMPYHALRDAEFARIKLREFINESNSSLLSSYINISQFMAFLETPVKWKPQIRFLRRMGSHLAWYDL